MYVFVIRSCKLLLIPCGNYPFPLRKIQSYYTVFDIVKQVPEFNICTCLYDKENALFFRFIHFNLNRKCINCKAWYADRFYQKSNRILLILHIEIMIGKIPDKKNYTNIKHTTLPPQFKDFCEQLICKHFLSLLDYLDFSKEWALNIY